MWSRSPFILKNRRIREIPDFLSGARIDAMGNLFSVLAVAIDQLASQHDRRGKAAPDRNTPHGREFGRQVANGWSIGRCMAGSERPAPLRPIICQQALADKED